MLAAPVTLKLVADGKAAELAHLTATSGPSSPDVAVRQAEAQLGRLAVKLATTTEFDGLQRYDLTLTPAGPVDVTSLVFEVPVKAKYASFLLPSNGISSSPVTMGASAWRSAFLPQVWLGNDDLGLAWFAESDQWWRPHDDQVLEVTPEGDRTVLRCKIVRSARAPRVRCG